MKFAAAALALAGAVAASYPAGNATTSSSVVSYTVEVLTAYTTYCPEATTLTHNGKTYTVSTPGYLTIDEPCTVTKPVYTSSVVYCHTCNATKPTTYPVAPPASTAKPVPTYVTAGAGKVAAVSGAGLALVMGAVALL